MHIIGLILVWLVAVMIIPVGTLYLLKNQPNAAGFGLPILPAPEARSWWQLKGIRDIAAGIAPILIMFVQPSALPWVFMVEALIPIGDMVVVLSNHGSRARALGVHGLTAAVMIIAVVLLFLG